MSDNTPKKRVRPTLTEKVENQKRMLERSSTTIDKLQSLLEEEKKKNHSLIMVQKDFERKIGFLKENNSIETSKLSKLNADYEALKQKIKDYNASGFVYRTLNTIEV